jgi:hypothetical protein
MRFHGATTNVPTLIGCNFDEGASSISESASADSDFRVYMESVRFATADSSVLDILSILCSDIPATRIRATFNSRPAAAPYSLGLQCKRACLIIGYVLMHAPLKLMTELWAASNSTSYS